MTATNHAVTGAIITTTMASGGLALLALPVAFLSHFVLDAIPHYDDKLNQSDDERIVSFKFKRLLKLDALTCLVLVAVITILQPAYWWLICLGAFAATSPDIMWLPRYIVAQKGLPVKDNTRWYEKFHSIIQWRTGNDGKYVEVLWFALSLCLLFILIV